MKGLFTTEEKVSAIVERLSHFEGCNLEFARTEAGEVILIERYDMLVVDSNIKVKS